ncbi:MAG: hypothetical protein R2769_16940 [Saprospiraceae bacterium]
MKKSYLIALAFAVLGFGIITAFSDEGQSPEEKEQMEKIQKMLESKLDSFRMVKEGECEARALQAAIMRADSIMAAPKTKKSGSAPTPKKAEPTNPKKDKMSGNQSTVEDKKSKMSGESKEETTAKKKSKMKGGDQ